MLEGATGMPKALINFLESIYRQDNVKCLVSGKTFQPWPKPNLIISDIFLDIIKGIRSIDPTITILGWNTTNNSFSLRMFGHEDLGGVGDIAAKALSDSERTGKPVKEIENQVRL
ncbi:glycosyltransferase family 1 protein [Sphaerobolus stellatus SS14]|uniref:Glycosyltransferase family 1 protein n=1 Tax=Sphaerobolus stellatus (strain SS14) TaxID=990650 RepID=A0A0C9VH30_SPHS4|nr:glycosyltransferase family 1 protein [Sphaerobolus stellatus SS14]